MAGQGGGQQQPDNSMGFLWIIIAVFAGGMLIWYVFREQIVDAIFHVKLGEIYLVSFVTDGLEKTRQIIKSVNPATVEFSEVAAISTEVGKYIRFPIAIILAVLAVMMFRGSPVTKFKKTYSMKRLSKQEAENWPYIAPVVNLDIINESIDEGKWAMAMPPMTFAKKYKLLKVEMPPADENVLTSHVKPIAKVIRHKANTVFLRQMGRPFQGVDNMRPHLQALFAAFAAKANGDRKSCMKLMRQMGASAAGSKIDFSGRQELIKKHINSQLVKKVLNLHAYEYGIMASMLEIARTDGVIASAEFIWLKPYDRPLWYMLNTVGRKVCPPEIAGPYAHWLVEKEMGRRLTVPMVDEATTALDLAINDITYQLDEGEVIDNE